MLYLQILIIVHFSSAKNSSRVSSTGWDRGEASPPSHLTSPTSKTASRKHYLLHIHLLCMLQVAHRGSVS